MGEFRMAAATVQVPFQQFKTDGPKSGQKQLDQLANWFSRSEKTLHFMAGLILGGAGRTEDAVRNSWIRVSRNPPICESEGVFRGWIMRILISESLSILLQDRT
jgi:hypothetical protein